MKSVRGCMPECTQRRPVVSEVTQQSVRRRWRPSREAARRTGERRPFHHGEYEQDETRAERQAAPAGSKTAATRQELHEVALDLIRLVGPALTRAASPRAPCAGRR